ncbi:hypothetical protein LCL95_09200 [Bacillus timonensis]|nr:hypothetical protein [Bacillus timonensis]
MMKKLFKVGMYVLTATLLFSISHVYAEGDVTVEGDTTRFVTGEAYASLVEVAGYDEAADKLYLNLEFATTKDISTLSYTVKVYNGSSTKLVELTSQAATVTSTRTAKATPVIDVADLTAAYRIVVTVESSTN